jgi:hypothetical protein
VHVPRRAASLLVALNLSACLTACGSKPPGPEPSATSASGPDWFVDRAADTGLTFTHVNGMSGHRYIAEIMGAGVALFDYDNDGDLDVFFPQGHELPGPVRGTRPASGRLYRNDLTVASDGTRTLHFTDVTAESGIVTHGYGMGAVAADIDNDGCIDLYVTSLGTSELFRNSCRGTFIDISRASGAAVEGWSVPAVFFDYDRDGWLDLYIGRYLDYSPEREMRCAGASGAADYCTPRSYPPGKGVLLHNRGDGRFTDVTARAGMTAAAGPALGAQALDADGDGWLDLFVANDSAPDQLWHNRHDGTFRDEGLARGVALTIDGRAESSMGVDAADFDDDGDDDLVVTEQTGEGHNLFVNDGQGHFEDRSEASGLGPSSLAFTGFGVGWVDVGNTGTLDLIAVNGTVQTIQRLAQAHDPFPLHQPKQIFRRRGNGRFEDATPRAGRALQLSDVSRGAAFGDIDNDGDTDIVIANNNGPARLLVNGVGSRQHWIGLRLIGADGHRDAVGARLEVSLPDGSRRWRRARSDGSYASSNDPRVLIGLGPAAGPVAVRVIWPDGRESRHADMPIDRYTTLTETR